MPDELQQSAPAVVENTEAAPANAASQEVVTEATEEQKPTPATKTFTQDEVNDIVKRAKAATESKTERRVMRMLEQFQQQKVEAPAQQKEETPEAYLERLVEAKLQERTQAERLQSVAQKTEDFYAKAEKIPGFDREVFDSLPLTPTIAQTIADADGDIAPKIMAYLSENPAEADRISKLPAARQAAELGKIETRVSESKPKAAAPKAPAPIDPIGAGKASVTDPSKMSAEEYYQHRMNQKPVWAR